MLSLRWEWVDFERSTLRMPDSKTDAKVVPLARAAIKLLAELPRCSDYVLPAATGVGHYTGLQKDWERVRDRAGLSGVRVHDLRHSFASFCCGRRQLPVHGRQGPWAQAGANHRDLCAPCRWPFAHVSRPHSGSNSSRNGEKYGERRLLSARFTPDPLIL